MGTRLSGAPRFVTCFKWIVQSRASARVRTRAMKVLGVFKRGLEPATTWIAYAAAATSLGSRASASTSSIELTA
jgi:hypothetical protein